MRIADTRPLPPDQRAVAPAAATSPTLNSLRQLIRAWMFAQPFHNVDLLAASLEGGRSLTHAQAIERCAHGLGGPCHVQAAGFLALLIASGFDAALASATINVPDDHVVVLVRLGGRVWLCDVGNGQPYLEPFPSDAPQCFSHLGWNISTRTIPNGIELRRSSPDRPDAHVVYRASLEPRSWSDFAATIDRHHQQPGFGPFLTGLRAVRIRADEMITLRDTTLTVYRATTWDRVELTEGEVRDALRDRLGLAQLPVDDAIAAWSLARRGSR